MNDTTADTLYAIILSAAFMFLLVASILAAGMVFGGPRRHPKPMSLAEENVELRMECFRLRDQLAAAQKELEDAERGRGFRLHFTIRKEDATGNTSGAMPVIQDTITRKEHQ